ncbi:MAG: hypothetical protein IPI96_15195 [Saprospiraceae bacterium]|nr:hypothetical protein [Saprospiraceae bacterium]
MPKSKDKQTPKPRGKYDEKLKVKGNFMDVMKVVVKDANTKNTTADSNKNNKE